MTSVTVPEAAVCGFREVYFMTMHAIDWAIVIGLVAVLFAGALRANRYTNSVAAFLAADRGGGRYLISVATGISMIGVISLVALFEQNYKVGFTAIWWGLMQGPAIIIMAITGWVIYRYRQTRAMTLAQFFEMRYSKRFRIFAGLVAYLAGIVNFGIFPAVGARFFMALCGLPEQMPVMGYDVATMPLLMAMLLTISLVFTFLGGQVAVMITDFLQGTTCNIVFVVVAVYLLLTFKWDDISVVLLDTPSGASLVHPFRIGKESHFDVWFYVIGVVIMFYGAFSWQGTQGYNCSAKSPHEAKMALMLGGWKNYTLLWLVPLVVPICVRTVMHHEAYTDQAVVIQQTLDALPAPNDEVHAALANQVRTPCALSVMLPKGLLGLICASMLAAFVSTHDTYLHSWGSILVQDVILPFRKTPISPRQHLWLLRLSILFVAIFIFAFSMIFQQTQYIAMFFAVTGAIFFGGAGSVIIGGLYWSRGTTPAAWAAMITGMVASLVKIAVEQVDRDYLAAIACDGASIGATLADVVLWIKTSATGQEMALLAILAAIGAYIGVSLLGPRVRFNMDKLLHRGRYAIAGESAGQTDKAATWLQRLGFSKEFTGKDRVVAYITLGWPLAWTVVFVVVTIYNYAVPDVPAESWLSFWHIWIWLIVVLSAIIAVWFAIGGFLDLRDLFATLKSYKEDETDDGRVADVDRSR